MEGNLCRISEVFIPIICINTNDAGIAILIVSKNDLKIFVMD
jgi:hypothetical protein